MLEKLAAVANFADQHGQYELANDLTHLVKNAQFWDAVRTLLNPSEGELGEDEGFWKRLTRGWKGGKFDRSLGMAFAINAEREKLNKKIQKELEPLKEFAEQVNAFYAKVRTGDENTSSQDFKAELAALKSSAGKMKNLVSGRDLRRALDLRNKLNVQQERAIEKIKGLDPQKKEYLVKLLRGEPVTPPDAQTAPAAKQEAVPGTAGEYGPASTNKKSVEQKAIADWLKMQKIPRVEYDEGFTTPRSRGRSSTITGRYGVNPFVLAEFFKQNPDKKDEVMDLVGSKPFNKMFEDIRWALELEMEARKKEEAAKAKEEAAKVPVTEAPAASKPVAEAPAASKPVAEAPAASKVEEPAAPVATPVSAEPPAPASAQEPAKPTTKAKSQGRIMRDKEMAQEQKAVEEKLKKKLPVPEEKTQRIPMLETAPTATPAAKADDLAVSMAQRTGRQITRLGRLQQLRKLADNTVPEGWADDVFVARADKLKKL